MRDTFIELIIIYRVVPAHVVADYVDIELCLKGVCFSIWNIYCGGTSNFMPTKSSPHDHMDHLVVVGLDFE